MSLASPDQGLSLHDASVSALLAANHDWLDSSNSLPPSNMMRLLMIAAFVALPFLGVCSADATDSFVQNERLSPGGNIVGSDALWQARERGQFEGDAMNLAGNRAVLLLGSAFQLCAADSHQFNYGADLHGPIANHRQAGSIPWRVSHFSAIDLCRQKWITVYV